MFFAQNVLWSNQNVKAIGAYESDNNHVDESIEPTGIVESLVHGKNSGSQTSFEQMSEGFRVSRGLNKIIL